MGIDDAAAAAAPPPGKRKEDAAMEDDNRINVYARLRPTFRRDQDEPGFEEVVNLLPDGKSVSLIGGKTYTFDGTFGPRSPQQKIWMTAGKPVVENVFKGYCGTCMCYGQTGTGKSFTMSNMNKGEEGVIMQSMLYMFQRQQEDIEREYSLKFSYLQIYRDRVGDLMCPERDNLEIVKSDSGAVLIPGLTEWDCNTRERFVELYEDGDSHRVVAATKMNPVSSRGHACLMISIRSCARGDDGTGETKSAKMWMIDLAGYERFSKTGILEGIRKEEAKCINASLLNLGNVISSLSDKSPHVPWRTSKLTRLLQDAVGGKAKCTVMLTLGPSHTCFHETVGTLYFGSRAMAVKTEAKLSLSTDYIALCKKLEAMLSQEREKYTDMEVQFTNRQIEAQQREDRMKREMAKVQVRHEEQMKLLIARGADPSSIQALIRQNEAEVALVQEQQQEEIMIAEEQHDEEVKQIVSLHLAKQSGISSQEFEKIKGDHLAEVADLRDQLTAAKREVERLRAKDRECIQLNEYISKLKEDHADEMMREREAVALNAGVSPEGVEELKGDYERQVQSVKSMLEATHEARMAEVHDAHDVEMRKARAAMEQLRASAAREYEQMRDTLQQRHEVELAKVRDKGRDIQEKLKRNHVIIKNSYQEQKERLKQELLELKAGLATQAGDSDDPCLRRLSEEHHAMKRHYQEQFDRMKRKVSALEQLQRSQQQQLGWAHPHTGAPAPAPGTAAQGVDVPPRRALNDMREGRLARIAGLLGMTDVEDEEMDGPADYAAWVDAHRPAASSACHSPAPSSGHSGCGPVPSAPPAPTPTRWASRRGAPDPCPSVMLGNANGGALPPPPPPGGWGTRAAGVGDAPASPRAEARLRAGSIKPAPG